MRSTVLCHNLLTDGPFRHPELLEAARECPLCAVLSHNLGGIMSLAVPTSVKSEAVSGVNPLAMRSTVTCYAVRCRRCEVPVIPGHESMYLHGVPKPLWREISWLAVLSHSGP